MRRATAQLSGLFVACSAAKLRADLAKHRAACYFAPVAALAQLVEHVIRNDGVRCSSHLSGTIFLVQI